MADGTALDLPPVHVPQSGVATVDVNVALAQAPVEVRAHLSTFGSAAIRYRHDWQGAVYATTSILDLPRSLEYSYPFIFPPGQGKAEKGVPASAVAVRDAANAQNYEGLWFRRTATSGGFLALANTSESVLGAEVAVSGLKTPVGRSISLPKHGTALIDLKDFFAGDDSHVGGITISHSGPPGALQLAGGLQDLTSGYSTNLPISIGKRAHGETGPRQLASAGLMANQQDPLLSFPDGLVFYPYAFFRNISSSDRTLRIAAYYMDNGHAKMLSLPDLVLRAGQVAELPVHDILASQLNVEGLNLTFAYNGEWGDIIAATGSTDATTNYVFPVVPQAVSPSGSKTSIDWLVSGGFDTMYTVWNPGSEAQDLLATLHFGTAGDVYRLPLHLDPYASAMIDIGELVRTQQLDQDGKTLPQDVGQGSLVLGSAAGAPEDLINVVFAGGIYNPRKATCGQTCETCNGFTGLGLDPASASLAVGGQQQYRFSFSWFDGTQHDVTNWSNWTSSQPSIAHVQTSGQTDPGLTDGEDPGGPVFVITVYGTPIPDNAGQICTPVGYLPPCPVTPQIEEQAPVTVLNVTVQSADITQDNITVVLSGPAGTTGSLIVKATGSNGQTPVDPVGNGTYGPGTYTFSFNPNFIPIGEYTTVTAIWTVSGTNVTGTLAYHFKVLGTYVQTQYNSPAESTCSGSATPVTVWTAPSCASAPGSMLSGFTFRLTNPKGGTGSGHSISYNDVHYEAYCTTPSTTDFRRNFTITGTLGPLNNSTVAANDQSELYAAGTRVYIIGEGVKTVTDRCGNGCVDITHLDNYTTNTACSGVPSLPNALTIRLY